MKFSSKIICGLLALVLAGGPALGCCCVDGDDEGKLAQNQSMSQMQLSGVAQGSNGHTCCSDMERQGSEKLGDGWSGEVKKESSQGCSYMQAMGAVIDKAPSSFAEGDGGVGFAFVLNEVPGIMSVESGKDVAGVDQNCMGRFSGDTLRSLACLFTT